MPGTVSVTEDYISEPDRQRFSSMTLTVYLKKQTLNKQFHKELNPVEINTLKVHSTVKQGA